MKRLILAGLVTCAAVLSIQVSAPVATAQTQDCSVVLCPLCPEGTVISPTPGNCCRCVKA